MSAELPILEPKLPDVRKQHTEAILGAYIKHGKDFLDKVHMSIHRQDPVLSGVLGAMYLAYDRRGAKSEAMAFYLGSALCCAVLGSASLSDKRETPLLRPTTGEAFAQYRQTHPDFMDKIKAKITKNPYLDALMQATVTVYDNLGMPRSAKAAEEGFLSIYELRYAEYSARHLEQMMPGFPAD